MQQPILPAEQRQLECARACVDNKNAHAATLRARQFQPLHFGALAVDACRDAAQQLVDHRYDAGPDAGGLTAGSTSYSWNAANQLTSLTSPAGASSYSYDGDGRRLTTGLGGSRNRPNPDTLSRPEACAISNGWMLTEPEALYACRVCARP